MTKRILYVDDEEDIRAVAELALGLDPDFEVTVCASGEEALKVVPRLGPDLILLDVMMPGLDGPSTFERLRELLGDALAPVVFCTARTQAEDVRHYLSLGSVGVIAKPFDPMTLAANIKEYLR